MSEKVTHIYSAIDDWRTGGFTVTKAEVVKETPKLYWIERNWPAFDTTQIYKAEARLTREDALLALRSELTQEMRHQQQQFSKANDKLDEFNAQFKEELS